MMHRAVSQAVDSPSLGSVCVLRSWLLWLAASFVILNIINMSACHLGRGERGYRNLSFCRGGEREGREVHEGGWHCGALFEHDLGGRPGNVELSHPNVGGSLAS